MGYCNFFWYSLSKYMSFRFFKEKKAILALIFVLFLAVRAPGLNLPYHQDEQIWPTIGSLGLKGLGDLGSAPHPPLTGIIFIAAVSLFGLEHLRYLPFIFGIINFWLLFFLMRYKFSWNAALWSVVFFSVSFYSVLASLMVDTDGQILPFFFLLSAVSFYKWRDSGTTRQKIIWGSLLVFSVLLGFLTKASFIIAACAIVFEFFYSKYKSMSWQKLIKTASIAVVILVSLVILVLSVLYILPGLNISKALAYWKHFIVFSGRNYLQISIQFLKALLYASPLLLASLLFLNRNLARKLRLFIIFLVLGLFFYLILFDFSSGALDRYFQFIIVPLSVIAGVVISNILEHQSVYNKRRAVLLGCAIGLALFLVQFLPHSVPALYPKTEWFSRVLNLKWNFMFPFIGGSGPMGFYVSWLFMALIWLTTAILVILAFLKIEWRRRVLVIILILGFVYNGIFIEEYLFGKINGSPAVLLENAVNFIKDNEGVSKVITYNNIGKRELAKIGKYERRLYAAPKFESGYTDILKNFKGHYLIIDIPRISSGSPYVKFFSSCGTVYEENSQKISAKIYNCQRAITP